MRQRRLLALVIALVAASAVGYSQARRPMIVDDLFNLQTLSEVRIAPDGASIAVVIQRTWSDPVAYRPYSMFGNDNADIWILPAHGGSAKNITRGGKDGSGYWNPVWSPDGERLALLSTVGGDNVRAFVWDKRSGRLTRVSDRGVQSQARTNVAGNPNPLQWVDGTRLLVTVLPEGEQPLDFRLRRQTARIASEAWRKLTLGRQPTSSVLESGDGADQERINQLLLVDVTTVRAQVLAEAGIRSVFLSPNQEYVAVVAQARRSPPISGQLLGSVDSGPSRLGIVSLREKAAIRWVEGVFNPVVIFGGSPHRWSPRGSALAVLGSERPDTGAPRAVFVVSPADLSVKRLGVRSPSALAWTESEQLLVRARTSEQNERADWWNVAQAEPRNLTSALTTVPIQLMWTRTTNEAIGLVDGALWSFDVVRGTRHRLTPTDKPVTALVWPAAEERAMSALDRIVFRVRDGDADSFHRVDLSTTAADVSSFPHPPKATALAAYHRQRDLAVFSAPRDPDGTYLWTGAGDTTAFTRRIALNEHLAGIAGAERTLVDYRSSDGQELKGMVLLPVGYQKGTRYPLVTWLYPGYIVRDLSSASDWTIKNQAHQDNLHLLAGAGYAVLIPSMPTPATANERDLNVLTIGVLPAIDRLVELGIVDNDRVAVGGQSGGGYATYGLITLTTRFKAAFAVSGASNHLTSYGVFSGETRYLDDVDEILSGGSGGRFGSPPWVNPEPYVANSPVLFMNRVETPLLIVHGDVDYVPVQHAEEVFTSLFRMGKRARFVRYWGESHGASDSPANLRDRWQQIFRWLDTYLRDAR